MKKISILFLLIAGFVAEVAAQDVKIITVVESIVPGGLGRSRMIENTSTVDVSALTTSRKDGTDGGEQRKVSRKKIKVDEFNETKLLNFFSLVGINFQNIASNDAVIAQRIAELLAQGYELKHIASGVESNAGEPDGQGIFVTRMFFIKS